jgi:hypothetical protein
MTPRSLFNIILKILGIFLIKDFLATIPHLLSAIYFMTQPDGLSEGIWVLLSTLMILVVYWFVFYYLVFKTELIIDQLKLDQGFDQPVIPLNMHRSAILSISVIVIGGFLIVDALPDFCRQIFSYFQEKRMTYGMTDPSIAYIILSGVKILIGVFLVTAQRTIVNAIEHKRRKGNVQQNESSEQTG